MDSFMALNGLRVLSAPGVAAGVCSAGLVLGVGRRDEDFVRGGITHLLEHLVMHEVGRIPGLDANAHVSLSTLEFVASGRPDRVAEFLRRVCDLLTDPPVERLAVKARVLRAEDGGSGRGPLAHLLAERYGAVDVGIAALAEPALSSITPEHLRAWAGRYVVRSNAALWTLGDLPDGTLDDLDRALPPEVVPERSPTATPRVPLPAWTEQSYDDVVALTFEAPLSATPAAHILCRRVEDELRHRRGLVYEVSLDSVRLDERRHHTGLLLALEPAQVDLAVGVVVGELQRLADEGPTGAELEHEVEDACASLSDPRNREDELSTAAEAAVRGWTVRDAATRIADLQALDVEQVRRAAALMRDTLLVGVPVDVVLQSDSLTRIPAHSERTVTGTTYKRRLLGGAPLGARLVVGDEGVTLHLRGEGPRTVLWNDVLGLVEERGEPDEPPGDREYSLVGVDGWDVPLASLHWRGGDEVMTAVLGHVPPSLVVTADPDDAPAD